MVVYNFLYTFCGGVVGYLFGLTFRFFRRNSPNVKAALMFIMAVAFPVVCNIIGFSPSKYVGILFFGYGCKKSWGEDRPT